MKTILLPFHDDEGSAVALDTACLLARRFDSYLEGLLCLENPAVVLGERFIAMEPDYMQRMTHEWRQAADLTRKRFADAVAQRGLSMAEVTSPAQGASAGWREAEGSERSVVGEYGRLFDVTVVGRTPKGVGPDWEGTAEAALFGSGRPTLIAPTGRPESLGDVIVIAWNGSTETARTIGLGMPILARAKQVIVLTVEGWMVAPHTGKPVAEHLQRHGIGATARIAHPHGRSNGETILAECAELGADLLFKGAYTHARFTQLVFGGATREILSDAKLPVLMAH